MARIEKFHLGGCSGGDCGCLWELDYRPLGMYGPRRRVRFKTRKQAERFLAETTTQAARGDYVPPARVPTFGEVAEDWYAGKRDRRPSHVADLRSRLDKHIVPILGSCKIDRVTVVAIEKLRDGLRDAGYAHRTINCILRIMSAVFRLAIKRGQCSKDPVASVERARPVAKELKEPTDGDGGVLHDDAVLNPAEIQKLLAAAADGFERSLFLTAYLTGARQGELLALRWTCIVQ
jgi:integrase